MDTLDGANIEIVDFAGEENEFIFGLTADLDVYDRNKIYNSEEIYQKDPEIKRILDQLINGFFKNVSAKEFKDIYVSLKYRKVITFLY